MYRGIPGDLGGPGVDLRPKAQENRPENFYPDCLQVPSSLCYTPSFLAPLATADTPESFNVNPGSF